MIIRETSEAEDQYRDAKLEGRTVVLGQRLPNTVNSFKLGNVQAHSRCIITSKLCCTFSVSKQNHLFFKFPLSTIFPSGSDTQLVGQFSFEIRVLAPFDTKVEGIASNCGCVYHSESKRFSVEEGTNENAILIDVAFCELSSICVESDGYLSAFVVPRLPQSTAPPKNSFSLSTAAVRWSALESTLHGNAFSIFFAVYL
jgi:hypothetical protein